MGLLKQMTGATPLEEARRDAELAEEGVAAEAKAIAACEEAVRDLGEQIAGTDPENSAALGRLVARRDASRGRLEALQARAGGAAEALKAAREALAKAENVAKVAELDRLRAEIRRQDDARTARVRRFDEELEAEIRLVAPVWDRALKLENELRAAGIAAESGLGGWAHMKGAYPGLRALEVGIANIPLGS